MDNNKISVSTFNKLADKYQEKYLDWDFYHDTYDRFIDYFSPQHLRVYDLACGPGNISKYLVSRLQTLEISGSDLSENMVTLAKQNVPAGDFQILDSRDFSRVSHQFDAIICGFVLPYLTPEESIQLIKDCAGKLTSGGLLYLSTMEAAAEKSGFQSSSTGDRVYIYYHQAEHLIQTLEAVDFEILGIQRKSMAKETEIQDLFIFAKLTSR